MASPERLKVVVREMTLEDVPRVHAIDTASFSLPWPERSFRFEIQENQAARCYVAEVQDATGETSIVGMLVMWLIIDEAHIATIAVDSLYRRYGIGKQLLAETLLQAYNHGVRLSYLEVRKSNLAAQQMYEKFGYKVVSIRPHYYRDNGEDALLMTLDPIDPMVLKGFAGISG